jgi:membrane-bound metal-dependent hydrolase YbcI (DUF457 family)
MPFFVAHALVGASVVVATSPRPFRANALGMRKLVLGSVLGIIPDLDYVGIWFLGLDQNWHRGFSHSLLVATIAGALLSLFYRPGSRIRWSIVYGAAMASHGVLDALLSVNRGAALLWPFSSYRFAAGLWEYSDVLTVKYYASLDSLLIKGVMKLLEYSAIEFVVAGAVLTVTFLVRSKFDSRAR